MQMNRRRLANGAITVWMDREQTIIHHVNGLTIALTTEEAQELKQWLGEQDATWEERAEFLNRQRMEREDALKQRFAGVDTLSLEEMLRQNKDNGPYDEYLQAAHDEVQRRQDEPMCLICAETNAQKLHACHQCGEMACIEHSELIDEKYWLCFDCIK